MGEQFTQSALSISNHILGLYPNSADAQKSIDKVKSLITKGISDVRMNNLNRISLVYFI